VKDQVYLLGRAAPAPRPGRRPGTAPRFIPIIARAVLLERSLTFARCTLPPRVARTTARHQVVPGPRCAPHFARALRPRRTSSYHGGVALAVARRASIFLGRPVPTVPVRHGRRFQLPEICLPCSLDRLRQGAVRGTTLIRMSIGARQSTYGCCPPTGQERHPRDEEHCFCPCQNPIVYARSASIVGLPRREDGIE
jgi:hypothetical protein